MKLKDGFVLRQVGGNHIVVPVGTATLDFRCIITLNDTGAFLWGLLDEDVTVEGMVAAMLKEYEVTEEVARQDIGAFVERLQQANLLDE